MLGRTQLGFGGPGVEKCGFQGFPGGHTKTPSRVPNFNFSARRDNPNIYVCESATVTA